MSLVYDALRQSNALPAQPVHDTAHAARPVARASTRWTPVIWGSALSAAVLASGLFYTMSPAPAEPLPGTAVATAPATAKAITPVAAAPVDVAPVSAQPVPPPAATRRDINVTLTPTPPAPLPAPATITPPQPAAPLAMATPGAPVTTGDSIVDVQSQQLSITVSRRGNGGSNQAAAAPVAAATAQIPALIKSLEAAVAEGDASVIDARLATLRSQLPGDSLTLLRTEAWVAHTRGDLPAAEASYRQILARIANDEQAGVNLALLEAGRGESDAAQTRLRRLAAENGNSALIGRALAQLQGPRP